MIDVQLQILTAFKIHSHFDWSVVHLPFQLVSSGLARDSHGLNVIEKRQVPFAPVVYFAPKKVAPNFVVTVQSFVRKELHELDVVLAEIAPEILMLRIL